MTVSALENLEKQIKKLELNREVHLQAAQSLTREIEKGRALINKKKRKSTLIYRGSASAG